VNEVQVEDYHRLITEAQARMKRPLTEGTIDFYLDHLGSLTWSELWAVGMRALMEAEKTGARARAGTLFIQKTLPWVRLAWSAFEAMPQKPPPG
jgi:hypothetical protein